MIGKVARRGSRLGGLLAYLFGPGRAEEHDNPHVVASWLGPDVGDDLAELQAMMRLPLALATHPPDKHVWHCAMRAAPEDRQLTDDEWAQIATDVAARVGLDAGDGTAACPWVAIRHADDHIHIAAVLVHEDGTVEAARGDFWAVAKARHAAEDRYGLRPTGPTDGTAPSRPTRGETEKAARNNRPVEPRVSLRQEVRMAAAASASADGFVEHLDNAGIVVKLRYSTVNDDEITGYSVGWPGDRTADGHQILYGGSKLAKDLSWPRLQQRWDIEPADGNPWQATTAAADQAIAELTADPSHAGDIAYTLADLLDASAWAQERRRTGPWHHAAAELDRHRRPPASIGPAARSLWAARRAIVRTGRSGDGGDAAAAALRLAALLIVLSHQHGSTATTAAHLLTTLGHPAPQSTPHTRPRRRPTGGHLTASYSPLPGTPPHNAHRAR
ncbi:relaxase/mobilization nuclease domain-containing protein [Salsipaludibacter albus]|uniref:relaxase/mobilization nuclease domain-containing protein n=1 Tax=Salsipaludibacter albus TaxID=2849650 RepID=UPI001EE426B9|nr:hypothetical protein [Salsipaludibacter albus]MBY5163283.1 hypothetical protein [Salsipaludibacter albus]